MMTYDELRRLEAEALAHEEAAHIARTRARELACAKDRESTERRKAFAVACADAGVGATILLSDGRRLVVGNVNLHGVESCECGINALDPGEGVFVRQIANAGFEIPNS